MIMDFVYRRSIGRPWLSFAIDAQECAHPNLEATMASRYAHATRGDGANHLSHPMHKIIKSSPANNDKKPVDQVACRAGNNSAYFGATITYLPIAPIQPTIDVVFKGNVSREQPLLITANYRA